MLLHRQPTFLDDPHVLIRHLQPCDFDFTRADNDFAERTNALLRSLIVLFLVAVLWFWDSNHASGIQNMVLGFAVSVLLLVVYVYNRRLSDDAARRSVHHQPQEGFEGEDEDKDKVKGETTTTIYRKPTLHNPTGNFMPTDYIDNPDALPAPPASNLQASAERMELFEEAIVAMNPRNNSTMMEDINASPLERMRFEQQIGRDFLTNPVTAATPDMEAYINFVAGQDFRNRAMLKDQWTTHGYSNAKE